MPYRTFPRSNQYSAWGFSCAFGGEVEREGDNENYPDGDWGSSDYQAGLPPSPVNFTGGGKQLFARRDRY